MDHPAGAAHGRQAVTPRQMAVAAGLWFVSTAVSLGLVVYLLSPMIENQSQRGLLDDFRGELDRAVGQTQSLFGADTPVRATELGAPVAIVEIPRLKVQQVVVEGVAPSQTVDGPGHVPGTAGPGQPGNAAFVGRHLGYGAPFHALGGLARGDEVVVSTAQGKSVYRVTDIRQAALDPDTTFAPSKDDRLTMVTSSSGVPWSTGDAVVVTASLLGKPFPPTPQNARSTAQDGQSADNDAVPMLILAFGAFMAVAAGAVLLYRRWRPISTYVLTAPALLALLVLSAESSVRLFPAWL